MTRCGVCGTPNPRPCCHRQPTPPSNRTVVVYCADHPNTCTHKENT